MGLRKLGNHWFEKRHGALIEQIHAQIANVPPESPEYIEKLTQLARLFSIMQPIEAEINTESGRLEALINSDEACIFIMNHDFQAQDPTLLSMFAVMLYEGYQQAGKKATCPRPKIILNDDILLSKGAKQREIYEKLGAVGVDASLHKRPSDTASAKRNALQIRAVVSGLVQNKNHVFIFPEGRMATQTHLGLRDKFQPGVGSMVQAALRGKSRVKVVPIGFAYAANKKEKQPLGSIHIGEPVYFYRDGAQVLTSIGNATEDKASKPYQAFFWSKQEPPEIGRRRFFQLWLNPSQLIAQARLLALPNIPPAYEERDGMPCRVITEHGEPVTGRSQIPFIADILAENLSICRQQARAALPKSSLGVQVEEY